MLPSRILLLGFLFVSFRPSLIRSHSCSSGASLLLSLSGFPLPIRFLSSASLPVPATQPSVFPFPASRSPLSAVPSVLLGSLRPRPFPLPFSLFPCLPSDFGTQLSALLFDLRCLASQWLPQRLDLFLSLSAAPLSFRLRFGYSAWTSSSRGHPFASDVTSAANFDIIARLPLFVNTFFQNFSTNFIFLF